MTVATDGLVTLDDVRAAADRVRGRVVRTPLLASPELAEACGSLADGLEALAELWRAQQWFRYPAGRQVVYDHCWAFVKTCPPEQKQRLQDALAYDYARTERVVMSRIPDFFDTQLGPTEQSWVRSRVQARTDEIRGQGIKLQYFAAQFKTLTDTTTATVCLFIYLTQTARGMWIEEQRFSPET